MKRLLLCMSIFIWWTPNAEAQLDYLTPFSKKVADTSNIDTVAWMYAGTLTLGANQGILHNWAAGGELASLSVNGLFSGNLTRYNHRHMWTNNLEAAYGLLYAYSTQFIPRKTDDRIDLTSKYGYKLKETGNFYLSLLFNAKTQFTEAYDYEVPKWDTFSTSRFVSPLYLILAPGLEYRKGARFNVFFSPLATKMTFVSAYYTERYPEGAYGVKNGQTFRYELGAYVSARYQHNFTDNIAYRGRVDLYSNYLAKDTYDNNGVLVKKDDPGNIDLLWENFITFKFFKYFSINFGLNAIYDNDVPYMKTYTNELGNVLPKNEPFENLGWWQINQTMSVGFNYTF